MTVRNDQDFESWSDDDWLELAGGDELRSFLLRGDYDLAREAQADVLGLVAEPEPAPAPVASAGPVAAETTAAEVEYILEDVGTTEDKVKLIKENVSVLDAYTRWIHKSQPKQSNKREGVKVSCPMPNHPDEHPSAWLNLDNGLWYCGACEVGGDAIDLYAIAKGLDVPNYRSNKADFKDVLIGMIDAHALQPRQPLRLVNKEAFIEPPDPTEEPGTENFAIIKTNVITLPGGLRRRVEDATIDWESIVTPGSFLDQWMRTYTGRTNSPDEYYFWLALQALAFAGGWHVLFQEGDGRLTKSGFYLCLYGDTSTGKTRSMTELERLINTTMPWDPDLAAGVKPVRAGSYEAMLVALSHEMPVDPTDPTLGMTPVGITAWYSEDELATYIAKATRKDSGHFQPLMQRLYDFTKTDTTLQLVTNDFSLASRDKRIYDTYFQSTMLTQPGAVNSLLRSYDINSGFLNRWVFGMGIPRGPLRALIRPGTPLPDPALAYDLFRGTIRWCENAHGHRYFLTDEAADFFEDQYVNGFLAELRNNSSGAMRRMTDRADLLWKKLMMLLAINDHLADDLIPLEYAEKALTILKSWAAGQMFVAQDMNVDQSQEIMDTIMECLDNYKATYNSAPTYTNLRKEVQTLMPCSIQAFGIALKYTEESGDVMKWTGTSSTTRKKYQRIIKTNWLEIMSPADIIGDASLTGR